ncbi:PEP-CTERM sorting domain-containing protein [Desulfogranum mediterraneum]|uniref:PEP-CTERM sorting domain-containing protein n=1 Tax=Desulfogranum mediterraneum TaxID=160661 RepID=UPI0003FD1E75|nr:PEP-CTERM sorting domain-containing protein [Desulfogranum mediterraneum]
MKRIGRIAVFVQLVTLLLVVPQVSALSIDTSADWAGVINNGWTSSGQSLTVDAGESFLEDIGFYYDTASVGQVFDFYLTDALVGGNVLFSSSFEVESGLNLIDVDRALAPQSTVYALVDYRGFSGSTAHFIGADVYSGGNSFFGHGAALGDLVSYGGLDHRFVATFSNGGGTPVPEPGTTLLFGVGVVGFAGVVRWRKR